jgi:DNA-binding NtrC family response regulator
MTKRKKKGDKKRILVIDDDKIVVELVKKILKRAGFEVETARDGVEGLEKIKQGVYNAIVSNLNMPRMKGDKLYLEVQKSNPDLAKKTIFISGYITDFIRSTGNRFLKKPFSSQELIEAVNEVIASHE